MTYLRHGVRPIDEARELARLRRGRMGVQEAARRAAIALVNGLALLALLGFLTALGGCASATAPEAAGEWSPVELAGVVVAMPPCPAPAASRPDHPWLVVVMTDAGPLDLYVATGGFLRLRVGSLVTVSGERSRAGAVRITSLRGRTATPRGPEGPQT